MFQFAQRRKFYFLLSACIILPGVLAMVYSTITIGSPVRLSIDFTGGTLIEVPLVTDVGEQEVRDTLEDLGVDDSVVQELNPKTIETELDEAGSRWQITVPDTTGLDRQAPADALRAYLLDSEALPPVFETTITGPTDGETDEADVEVPEPDNAEEGELQPAIFEVFPEEGGLQVFVGFADDVENEDAVREELENFGLETRNFAAAPISIETVASSENADLLLQITEAASIWQIIVQDADLLKYYLIHSEDLPALWSPTSEEDDPFRQDSIVATANADGQIVLDVSFESDVEQAVITSALAASGLEGFAFESAKPLTAQAGSRWQIRMEEMDSAELDQLIEDLQSPDRLGAFWSPEPLKADPERNAVAAKETVSATVGREVTRAAFLATMAVAVIVLGFIVFAFRRVPQSFRYGACAIIAMFHDLLVTMGVMSFLGLLFGWEVDALFLTAILTVVGFSVQDSIVVFDRIRENIPKYRGEDYEVIINRSVLETIHRSLATQLNAIFVLVAILLFGGETIKQFIAIMLIGLMSGTYSSIFNAVPLLVAWEKGEIPFVNREAKRRRQEEQEQIEGEAAQVASS
ncbi:MAG: protein translocase subunit SecF [Chloroflexi bacterium]|nr:protein translocase subunit SecF [Chloroflexota bacterium]